MAKKKKKHPGHYCRICGEYKANEKFSGKGHARHICKSCMSASNKGTSSSLSNEEPIVYDEDEYSSFFMDLDEIDLLPPSYEDKTFKKLGREEKTALKILIGDVITEYWSENRQIPFSETLSEVRKYIIRLYKENYEIRLKDDTELKNYIQAHTIGTINRLLKSDEKA